MIPYPIFYPGARSAAICDFCRTKVTTTMKIKDYTPEEWNVTVPDLLVGVCDQCNKILTIPGQSIRKLNSYRPPSGWTPSPESDRNKFWDEFNAEYSSIKSDSQSLANLKREDEIWDGTVGDGLDNND